MKGPGMDGGGRPPASARRADSTFNPLFPFRDVPIRRKLYSTIAVAVLFAVAVAAAAVLIYETRTFRPRILAEAEIQAGMLAEILVPPIEFHDSTTCSDYLGTLRNWPEISHAVLTDTLGRRLASYARDPSSPLPPEGWPQDLGATFGPRSLTFVREVLDGPRKLGYLSLNQDLPPLLARLPQYGIMLAVVGLSLAAVAVLLALALKYSVTAPLIALADTARAVTERKDYRIRAPEHGADEMGTMTAAFNQMLDTLEQRDISLSESRHLLQSIIDYSAAVIFVKDLQGRFLLVNRRFQEIFRVSDTAVLGKTDYDIFPRERAEVFRESDARALQAGQPVESEDYVNLEDGRHIFVSLKTPLRDSEGNAYAICGISTDITQIKAYEEQLRQSQKMEAIGRLAGGISHDFNNLLTAINGYSTLALQEFPVEDRRYGYLEEILKAGERAAGLTRQLLAYSRKQLLEAKVWNLNEIVADMERMLRRLIGEDIRLTTSLAPDLGSARVDRGQVEQIILNLAINSRDAMPEGGTLTIETRNVVLDQAYAAAHREASPGSHVMLSITDNGTGMSPEVMAHIFEPFFTTKEVGKGTGLGLSVVYGIVKQSGGSVSVYSEPGKGTTFRIYMPEVSGLLAPSGEATVGQAPSHRGDETLLLVEDDEQVRAFARHILESKGYNVLQAANGIRALEVLADPAIPIQMVISDVVMPDLGGPAMAERLKETHPNLPVLFISGYAESAMTQTGSLAEGAEFLQKPFTPFDLARKVRECLDEAKSRRPA